MKRVKASDVKVRDCIINDDKNGTLLKLIKQKTRDIESLIKMGTLQITCSEVLSIKTEDKKITFSFKGNRNKLEKKPNDEVYICSK